MSKPDIRLDPVAHRYWDNHTGHEYLSVTQLVGRHKSPFDEQFHSARIAKRDGKTQKQVLAEWALKRDTATERGQRLHSVVEGFLKRNELPSGHLPLLASISKWIAGQRPDFVLSERILFDEASRTAGTMDIGLVFHWPSRVVIPDVKTNAEGMKAFSYNRKMLAPLEHLDDCDKTHYALQLSLYALMWERQGYAPDGLWALWIEPPATRIDPIPLPYLRDEAKALLAIREAEVVDN